MPENSLYYTLFVLGGVGARGEGGYFGGFKASGNETEAGLLFFGIRGADASGDSILAETPHRRLNGEATKVEFAFGFHNNSYGKDCSSLRMYADGELVLWEQCVPMDPSNAGNQTDYYNSATNSHDSVTSAGSAIPNATSGPLSIGRGGHDPELSKFIDPLDSGGCFSPNFHGWTGDLARGPHVPPGNLACGERNRWGEFDGGDVMWCPHTWNGSFPTAVKHAVSASLAGFDPRDNDCEAVAYARAAPMYSAAPGMGDDKWQRNNMALSDDSHSVYTTMMSPLDEGHVNLRRLGRHPRDTRRNGGEDWWGEKFAFARFRFTTPEYFGRAVETNLPDGTGGFSPPDLGKIRLMALDQDQAMSTDYYTWHEGGVCVSLFPVFPAGFKGSASPTRQHNNKTKLVLHACGETTPDTNYELDRPGTLLEPSTAYLVEVKFNFRSSDPSVQVYLQGVLVDEAPWNHFPCKMDGHASCQVHAANVHQNDEIPFTLAFGDNSHHITTKKHWLRDWYGVEGFADPLTFVGGGSATAYRTSWGGIFSEKLNPTDESCSRDGRCYRLTSPLQTWGEWTSGELHFCKYTEPDEQAPSKPEFDAEMFKSEIKCAGCYPLEGGEVFVGYFFQGNAPRSHGGIVDDNVFQITAATMGGKDALGPGGDPTRARWVKLPTALFASDTLANENRTTFLFWICDDVFGGKGTLLMHAVSFSTQNDTVVAVSEGGRRLGEEQGAESCVGDETRWAALDAWADPAAVSSAAAFSAATGVNTEGFGLHSVIAEVWSPVRVTTVVSGTGAAVFTQTESVAESNATVVAATIGGSVFAGPDLGFTGGGFSQVHVLDVNEALQPRDTAYCGPVSGTAGDSSSGPGRRRSLLRAPSISSSRGGRELLQDTAADGCYDSPSATTPIADCVCHETCGQCGFYNWPTAENDCVTCADGSAVTPEYEDGTGYCGSGSGGSDPPITWRDQSTWCDLWLLDEVCNGWGVQSAGDCRTGAPYDCVWDSVNSQCKSSTTDMEAFGSYRYGVTPQTSFLRILSQALSDGIGCSSTNCDVNLCVMVNSYQCEPRIPAVLTVMDGTSANEAISAYAVSSKMAYTCQEVYDVDEQTMMNNCNAKAGCTYVGSCAGNHQACWDSSYSTCESNNCVWDDNNGSNGSCSGLNSACATHTDFSACKNSNCHSVGCESNSDYHLVQIANACGTGYDDDNIAVSNHRDDWKEVAARANGTYTGGGGGGGIDICASWVQVALCGSITSTNESDCPDVCEFNGSVCATLSDVQTMWESAVVVPVAGIISGCESLSNCDEPECFQSSNSCEMKPASAMAAIEAESAPPFYQSYAYTVGLTTHGYCGTLSNNQNACEAHDACEHDGSSCSMKSGFDDWIIGENCASDSGLVDPYLNMLAVFSGYDTFAALSAAMSGTGVSPPPDPGISPSPDPSISTAADGCYDSPSATTPIADCVCHETCGQCGFYNWPTAENDCVTCADGSAVTPEYEDGTGYCGNPPAYPSADELCPAWSNYLFLMASDSCSAEHGDDGTACNSDSNCQYDSHNVNCNAKFPTAMMAMSTRVYSEYPADPCNFYGNTDSSGCIDDSKCQYDSNSWPFCTSTSPAEDIGAALTSDNAPAHAMAFARVMNNSMDGIACDGSYSDQTPCDSDPKCEWYPVDHQVTYTAHCNVSLAYTLQVASAACAGTDVDFARVLTAMFPPRTALVSQCHYPQFASQASPELNALSPTHDLSGDGTLVVVRLNVSGTASGGTVVTPAGVTLTENVTNCHYKSRSKQDVIKAWNCGELRSANSTAELEEFGVSAVQIVTNVSSAVPYVKPATVTGPALLTRTDFEGECECPTCYQRFGFKDIQELKETAARDAVFAQ